MQLYNKSAANAYIKSLYPQFNGIDNLLNLITDAQFNDLKSAEVFKLSDVRNLIQLIKLDYGTFYNEDFAKVYCDTDDLSEIQAYFNGDSEKKHYVGADLAKYRLFHPLGFDISKETIAKIIDEKLKDVDVSINPNRINALIDEKIKNFKTLDEITEIIVNKFPELYNKSIEQTILAIHDNPVIKQIIALETNKFRTEEQINKLIDDKTALLHLGIDEVTAKQLIDEKLVSFDPPLKTNEINALIDEKIKLINVGLNESEVNLLIVKSLKDFATNSSLLTVKQVLETKFSDLTKNVNDKIQELNTKLTDAKTEVKNDLKSDINNLNTRFDNIDSKYATKENIQEIVTKTVKENVKSETEIQNIVQTQIASKADKDLVYSKDDIDSKLNNIKISDEKIDNRVKLNSYLKSETYNKSEIDAKIPTFDITEYAKKSETYNKTETYNKSEIDDKIPVINISDYYNKSKVDEKIQALSDSIASNEQIKTLVKNEIKKVVKNAPEALDTIEEIATALKNNPDVITEILAKIETKLNKDDTAKNSEKLGGKLANEFATKADLQNLNVSNYYNKSETDSTFLKISNGLTKSEAETKYAKKTDILDKTTILTKSEAETTFVKTDTLDTKYLKISDAFTETKADTKYPKKSEVLLKTDNTIAKKSETYNKDEVYNKTETYNKTESDGRYLPKNAKIKITGDVVSEIQDSNEIPFRLNSDGEIKFVPYSVIKATGGSGGASSEAVKKAVKDEVRTQVGNFSLGDGYLIAKSLEQYIPGLNVPARVYGKGVTNLNIEFDLLTNSGGEYGNGFGAIIFYRDGKRYYPKYKNPSNSEAESTVILSLTEVQDWDGTKWNNLPAIPSDYVQEATDLKVLIKSDKCYSFNGSYNSISCLAGLFDLYFLSDSTPSKISMHVISNDGLYFDTISFSAGNNSRYTDTLNLKFKNTNTVIYDENFTLAKNQTKTLKTIFKDLAEILPEVEKTKIIKGLEDYSKGYIDTELNKETYIKKTNLNKEVQDQITERFKDSNAAQEAVSVWAALMGKMGFIVPLNPTRKPPKTKIIFDNLNSVRASYGPTLWRIRLFNGVKKLYLAGYETISNSAPFKVLFSETDPNKSFTELLNNNLKTYTPKTGEYLGTISTTNNYSGVTYNPIQSFANDNGTSTYYLGTKGKNCKFELELENLYPSKITVTNGVTEAYCTDTFEIKIYDETNCIGYKKIENFDISALVEYETLRISQRQFAGAEGILNGDEVKEIIKETVKTDVQTKFNETDFLSSDNLDTKIDLRLPNVAQTFFENGGMEKYLEKVFNLVGQDFPVTLTQKPTDFTLKIDSFGEFVGYAALGTIKMTNNEDKLLYLKEISTGYVINKPLKVILTTDPAKGCVGSVPSKDLSNYVLQADEYEAEVQGFNTYNNGTYYLPYYVLTQKETNPSSYLTYYMGASNVGAGIRITIKNFYPKTLEIKNGIPGRYTKEYRVKMYNGNDCYFNRLVKDQVDPGVIAQIKVPKFD